MKAYRSSFSLIPTLSLTQMLVFLCVEKVNYKEQVNCIEHKLHNKSETSNGFFECAAHHPVCMRACMLARIQVCMYACMHTNVHVLVLTLADMIG